MLKITRSFVILLLTVSFWAVYPARAGGPQGQPGSDGLGDPLYPLLGDGGYDALHYALDLNVDVDKNELAATVMMDATATEDLSAFNLDFVGFTISALTVNGASAQYTRTTHELTITPAST